MDTQGVVFVGFNKRVAALDRRTGEILWKWQAPDGSGFVSLLLDEDRLFVAVSGYTYCLDGSTGLQIWRNPMKGFGTGATSLATVRGHTPHALLGEAAAQQASAAAAAGS